MRYLLVAIAAVLAIYIYWANLAAKTPVEAPLATSTPLATAATADSAGAMGTITGKLCFPSEFLPAGEIEAKDVDTEIGTIEVYAGSENGGGQEYSIAVKPGTYIMRYKAVVDPESLYGYHTVTCPTGMETTCNADNPREHIKIEVSAGETVEGVDLCDFYYNPDTPPEF